MLKWVPMFTGTDRTWDDLPFLREHWDGPIVFKGIQHVADARPAAEAGMDGIMVSNHGGRQVDGAIGSLDALPGIVAAVGDQLPVLFDSGIRGGADVVKALALGAERCCWAGCTPTGWVWPVRPASGTCCAACSPRRTSRWAWPGTVQCAT